LFRGAGWNVIKVVWGRRWDELLARDRDGALVSLMNNTLDGDYQTYKSEDGAYVREHFFGRDPRTAKLVEAWTDEEVWGLQRGGHDYRKLYAAYDAAMHVKGQPTVILAKTIKGWTLGSHFEARNSTHQMKKLTLEDLKGFRDKIRIPITDAQLEENPYLPPYYHPGPQDEAVEYMLHLRRELGGSLPARRSTAPALKLPGDEVYSVARRGSGKQEVATTMAFVRLLKDLMKDPEIGYRFVPIVPDEARTFGIDSLFPTAKIYSPHGQRYTSVDRELILSYRESQGGQILHEGISEAGSVASFTAVGSSYSTHGEPMIPVYIFYSMFGFQRTGDLFWAAGDSMARGFVLGATAGRTTLNGEGLQHQDGHTHLLMSTIPCCVCYDVAYAYELAVVIEEGLRRMIGDEEAIYYYITLQNENYPMPPMPEGAREGILRGLYRLSAAPAKKAQHVQLFGSGSILLQVLRAREILEGYGVSADVWSVTSYVELRRDALDAERHARLNPGAPPKPSYLSQALAGVDGPFIAASDFMKAVPDQIARFVPGRFVPLGTDGFGMSDTRAALRRHFEIDAESIAIAALDALRLDGKLDAAIAQRAIAELGVDPEKVDPTRV
ncbi:MAG: pyruvate dehydrogenase (acetyl-transferring), homodimeric type, partial [Polyangiaceae bacterium]|nr:pyruvate dehydrogenase (acetyl-transferring), homodimeric type [Polyangiaceae bacterium]